MHDVVPLAEVTRGDLAESIHWGACAVVDAQGTLLYSLGNPHLVTYPRSSAKPLQVLPLLESGGADHFGFSDRQIAIMCASHAAEDFHVENVQSILERIGLEKSALMCGIHPPANREAAERLRAAGLEPNTLHSNCSGKHAGMLALAKFMGAPSEGYYQPDHPVQQRIISVIAEFTDTPAAQIPLASDGCTVPTFGLPLSNFALALARLVDPRRWSPARQAACRRVVRAMQGHPDMVSGTARFDTDLMRVAGEALIAKGGAEGYAAVAVLPCPAFPRGAGIALKVSDGDSLSRARPAAMLDLLRQLGVLNAAQLALLSRFHKPSVLNMRGERVGEVRPCFTL